MFNDCRVLDDHKSKQHKILLHVHQQVCSRHTITSVGKNTKRNLVWCLWECEIVIHFGKCLVITQVKKHRKSRFGNAC